MPKSTLGNKQIMATNIRKQLDKLGLNVKDFANTLGFKYTTTLDWVNAKTYPRIDKIEKMANFFGIEKSELVEEHNEENEIGVHLNRTFSHLTLPRKRKVVDYADTQLKDQWREENIHSINELQRTYTVDVLGAVSAGTGEWLDEEQHNHVAVSEQPPVYDFAVQVNGDSMEPMFADEQIIYVKRVEGTEEVRDNQIVIAELNGNAYVKKIAFDGDRNSCRLISLNKKYADIIVKPDDSFKVIGVVVI